MRLAGGSKVGLDSQVNLDAAIFKPYAAAFPELRRFGNFRDPEKAVVEVSGGVFLAGGHRELYVIDSFNLHFNTMLDRILAPASGW